MDGSWKTEVPAFKLLKEQIFGKLEKDVRKGNICPTMDPKIDTGDLAHSMEVADACVLSKVPFNDEEKF